MDPFISKICIILLGADASYRALVQELILSELFVGQGLELKWMKLN